jgi:hypothetical protein
LAENISADKRLVIFDKIFSAYHDARGFIRADLVLNLLDLFLFNHESITKYIYLLRSDLFMLFAVKIMYNTPFFFIHFYYFVHFRPLQEVQKV